MKSYPYETQLETNPTGHNINENRCDYCEYITDDSVKLKRHLIFGHKPTIKFQIQSECLRKRRPHGMCCPKQKVGKEEVSEKN